MENDIEREEKRQSFSSSFQPVALIEPFIMTDRKRQYYSYPSTVRPGAVSINLRVLGLF